MLTVPNNFLEPYQLHVLLELDSSLARLDDLRKLVQSGRLRVGRLRQRGLERSALGRRVVDSDLETLGVLEADLISIADEVGGDV